jgi:proteasome accessory factor A
VALRKVLGVETEYGILVRGGESNPIAASSVLINAYVQDLERGDRSTAATRIGWDFEDEQPGNDARGFNADGSMPPEVETHLVNAVLTNGARYYVDHAHPEVSTPECADPRSIVVYDRAAEVIVQRSMEAAAHLLPEGQEVVVYKNNSDRKGNSYGCHENYLMDRQVPFSKIVAHAMPHLITRQIFTGAGKVGTEASGLTSADVPFQLTQRADFFEEEVGLETTLKRPIVNTRDEPHADAQKYRRLHVIVGDANLSEVATFLKVGTTALVLSMIEERFITQDLTIDGPVSALRAVSHDPTLKQTVTLTDGRTLTGVQLQLEYLDLARKYVEDRLGSDADDQTLDVLARWESVLDRLERDPMLCASELDWVAKLKLLEQYRQRDGLDWDDAKLQLIDYQYSDIRPEKGLYHRLAQAGRIERLLDDSAVEAAMHDPPEDTRAYFRGRCLEKFASEVAAASWDSVIFDLPGRESLQRVPTIDPLRGSKAHVGELLDRSDTAEALVAELTR